MRQLQPARRSRQDLPVELLVGEFAAIRATKQPAAGREAGERQRNEFAVVAFHTENLALFVAGKGRRIEHDRVEGAALFREATEPMERIALAEMMPRRIETVVREIA